MSVKLVDGAILSIATTYGPAKTISALTNANPAVASSTAHGLANGALFEITSGWNLINGSIRRAAGVAANALNYEGLDSTDTALYPAGAGIGTIREITAFAQIQQVLGISTTGGDQQYANFSFLEDNFERQLPTITSAQSLELTIGDDPTLAGYLALKAASDSKSQRAVKLALPGGSFLLYNAIISLNETPTLEKGAPMSVRATLSLQGRPVRYAA